MTNNKAQGLSINTIILLILGIIVFAILTYIFYNTSKDYGSGTSGAPSDVKSRLCSSVGICAKNAPSDNYDGPVEVPPEGWIDCDTDKGYTCFGRS